MVSTTPLRLPTRNRRAASIIDVLQTKTVGWSGADSGPRLGLLDQASKLVQISVFPADLEEGADHPSHLVSQKALTNEIEIETIAAVMKFSPK
jgi:hypothetical protein